VVQNRLVATGILGKEFIKWKRDGRLTHIFNPSAFSLCLFSVVLIATDSTQLTFGEQIATTMGRPPHIYLEIFLLGLVVQALFSVTLVTLSAAAALCILNIAFTGWTGVYHFVDSNIPVAVFLGMHLLITDPATSPRKAFGKIVFGGLYGAGVFAVYGVLGWLGAPRFYDKLLCVPALNLTVQALDRLSDRLEFARLSAMRDWTPRQLNFAYMSIWIALFIVMTGTGFVGGHHPGGSTEFWRTACNQGRWHACETWEHTLEVTCSQNRAAHCLSLGNLLAPKDPAVASGYLDQACDLGNRSGCAALQSLIEQTGLDAFLRACDEGKGAGCFILGVQYQAGGKVAKDDTRALALFRLACAAGSARGCAREGEFYFLGRGVAVDPAKALEGFELACTDGYGPGCYNAGVLYRDGDAGRTNAAYGMQLIAQACEMGTHAACSAPK
jgi:TPR repeat protein